MKACSKLIICLCFVLTLTKVLGQAGASKPTNEEAKAACLTLEHLLVIARNDNRIQDAVSLSTSYNIVRKYVSDGSLSQADAYVGHFVEAYPALIAADNKKPGGFNWLPAHNLVNDQEHKSGAIIYDKRGTVENLHLKLNSDAVTQILKTQGAVPAEAAK